MQAKYEPLEVYLKNLPRSTKEVSMSFRELEAIIGASLPASAHTYQAWWANQTDVTNRSQAKSWLSAGFIVDGVQFVSDGGTVTFRRK